MSGLEISTTRFGQVAIAAEDALHFPQGIRGLGQSPSWVLLAEAHNDALGWLQSIDQPQLALAVVNPRRYVPDYQIRVTRSELNPLGVVDAQEAHVLVIVSKHEAGITLNLKAPLLINLARRTGTQVVNNADFPLQYVLAHAAAPLKKSA